MECDTAISINTKGWIRSSTEKLKKESHPDDLIHAWELGFQEGFSKKEQVVHEYYQKKLNTVLEAATGLFNILNENVKMNCQEAYFKPIDIKTFNLLYLVDINTYLSDKLKKCYDEALKLKNEFKSENVSFNFTIKPVTEHTNTDNIYADGYMLKYAPKSSKT